MGFTNDFTNKNVLITGGGSGIGRAAALRFAGEGANIAIIGRRAARLDSVQREIEAKGTSCTPLAADVSDDAMMKNAFVVLSRQWDRIDVLFANAGINGLWAPIDQFPVEEWDKIHAINMRGTFLTVKYAIPLMKERGGSIIIDASINGVSSFSKSGIAGYASSKAAQVAFGKVAALELAPFGIRVNMICPGATESNIDEHMEVRGAESLVRWIDYPRGFTPLTGNAYAKAEQVANTVLFLAGDSASHVTGAVLLVDGGSSLIG